jgi:hypothetical protein
MKKFILFLFLATTFTVSARAQEGDEFLDPTLQGSGTPPPTKSSATTTPADSAATAPSAAPSNTTTETEIMTDTGTSPNPVESFDLQETPAPTKSSLSAEAQPIPEYSESQENPGDVLIETQADLTQSYKQRRGHHGVLFSLDYEKFNPVDYFSQYRDAYIAEDLSLIGAEIGYKYNFKLGSVAILVNGAFGTKKGCEFVDADGNAKSSRDISITRYGLALNYAMDNIMQEPWIVPYGQVGIHQFEVSEDDQTQLDPNTHEALGAVSTTTSLAFDYRVGLLFQLNWIEKSIDPSTHTEGLLSSGLQNTFLDIYLATHVASSEIYDPTNSTSEGDPDLHSETELGVGLKMEF